MSRNDADVTRYAVRGSGAGYQDWIGREQTFDAPFPVNEAQIAYYAAMVEDANENYWDAEAAGRRYGAIVSPPGMLMTWALPTPWHPQGPPAHGPIIALEVPLPGDTLINVSTETWFHAPMRVGDRLRFSDRIESISGPKRSAVGEGYFLTSRTVCRNQDGVELATNVNVVYRYEAADSGRTDTSTAADLRAEKSTADRIAEIRLPVTTTRLVVNAAATRDFFPGHHDDDYARAQGVRSAYHNTMFFQGLVDRAACAWAGYDAWLAYRQLRMVIPACKGDTMRTMGEVAARREQNGRQLADLAVDVMTEQGLAVSAKLTLDLDGCPPG